MQEYNHDFFNAIKKGDRALVEQMIESESWLPGSRDPGGMSAVLTALYYQQPEIADLLIDRGAPLNLFEAAASGKTDLVLEMIDSAPRKVNTWSADGFQPLGLASFFGHTDLARALLERGAEVASASHNLLNVQPLHSAVAGQHLEIARALLEKGANPNARQGEGFTPLHGAAQNAQPLMVALLLEYGANPSLRNDAGELPVDFAREAGAQDIVAMLER